MDTVQPLQEHWTPLIAVRRTHSTPAPVSELVAELKPLTLDENTEPLRTDSLGYTDSLGNIDMYRRPPWLHIGMESTVSSLLSLSLLTWGSL